MAELGDIKLWRLKETVELGTGDSWKTLPNGNSIPDFKVKYTFKCAPYRVTDKNTLQDAGITDRNTTVLAVRKHPNIDYGAFVARYKGDLYNVTLIVDDPSKIYTYELISLTLVNKEG